jgi:DNA-binding transcriptional ArsR family regulator
MLRIHFTPDDVARVRMVTNPDPLWDIVLSAHQLQTRVGPVFGPFRQHARLMTRSPDVHQAIGTINAINPRCLYFPDFLTPTPEGQDLETGVDMVLGTPRVRLRRELTTLAGYRRLPSWVRQLADGDGDALRMLKQSLLTYHRVVVDPYASRLRVRFDADRAIRLRALLDGGPEAMLDSLRPTLRWRSPVLEAAFPRHQDLHLRGRGLVLIPSPFCWRKPVTLADSDLPPVLVYPAVTSPDWSRTAGEHALAALIGHTRATALEVICTSGGTTTGQLARMIGVAVATASEHAKVLRDAGLATSIRNGNSMVHVSTPLGRALLNPSGGQGK